MPGGPHRSLGLRVHGQASRPSQGEAWVPSEQLPAGSSWAVSRPQLAGPQGPRSVSGGLSGGAALLLVVGSAALLWA